MSLIGNGKVEKLKLFIKLRNKLLITDWRCVCNQDWKVEVVCLQERARILRGEGRQEDAEEMVGVVFVGESAWGATC